MNLSIIVPIYNVEKYLDKCIQSLINQKLDFTYEIILVNDGSTDNSEKIIKKYLNKSNIIYINKKNGGLSDARNIGIENAKGEYIGFVDSDDYISDDMYNKMLIEAKQRKVDIVICGISRVNENGKEIRNYIPTNNSFEEILKNAYACNKIYKKELFKRISYPIGKHYEDIFTIPKLYLKSKKVFFIQEKLYYYLERDGAITQKCNNEKITDIIDAYLELKNYLIENNIYSGTIKKEFDQTLKVMKNSFILRTISGYSINFFTRNQKIIIEKFKALKIWKKEDYIKLYFSKYFPKNFIKKLIKGE